MPGAIIVADQPTGAGSGTPGVARNDLWLDQEVELSVGTSGNTTYSWELLSVPVGSATTLSTPTSSTSAFTPDTLGTYRLRLTTNGGGPGNVQIRVYRVRYDDDGALANRGWVMPAPGEFGTDENNYESNAQGYAEPLGFIFNDLLPWASGLFVYLDGSFVGQRRTVNFIGATVDDNEAEDRIDVTGGGGFDEDAILDLTAASSVSAVDILPVVLDPSGTPLLRKATARQIFAGGVSGTLDLTVAGSAADTDLVPGIVDPGGTPLNRSFTVDDLRTLSGDAQHGNRGGGSLHAVAGGSAGFMSSTDKLKLDGIEAGATNTPLDEFQLPLDLTDSVADPGTTEAASKSDHIHAHGNRGGGSLHTAAVSGGDNGFMTGTDKAKLDVLSGTGAFSSRPASPVAGSRYAPTDGGFEQTYDGTSWYNLVGGCVLKEPPEAATIATQTNYGTSTLTKTNGVLVFQPQVNATIQTRTTGKTINTLSGAAVTCGMNMIAIAGVNNAAGVYMRESSSGKILTHVWWDLGALSEQVIATERWTNPTTRAAFIQHTINRELGTRNGPYIWRLIVSGSDVLSQVSADGGLNWITLATTALTTAFTTQPNEFGICANVNSSGTPGPVISYQTLTFVGD